MEGIHKAVAKAKADGSTGTRRPLTTEAVRHRRQRTGGRRMVTKNEGKYKRKRETDSNEEEKMRTIVGSNMKRI